LSVETTVLSKKPRVMEKPVPTSKELIVVLPEDVVFSSDLFLIDFLNQNRNKFAPRDYNIAISMVSELFSDKDLFPLHRVYIDPRGEVRLAHLMETLDKKKTYYDHVICDFIKTKNGPRLTADIWKFLLPNYRALIDKTVCTAFNKNAYGLLKADTNILMTQGKVETLPSRDIVTKIVERENQHKIIAPKDIANYIESLIRDPEMLMPVFITLFSSEFLDDIALIYTIKNYCTPEQEVLFEEYLYLRRKIIMNNKRNTLIMEELGEEFKKGYSILNKTFCETLLVELWDELAVMKNMQGVRDIRKLVHI